MKNIKYILLILAVSFLSGCSGFLDKAPKLAQSTELTLSTYAGLNKSVAGAYGPLQSPSWYGADFILSGEMRSGNGKRKADGDFQSGRYKLEYTWNYTADSAPSLWGFGYYVISAVNNVLDNLEGKTTKEITEKDLNNLRAEALFLRALAHFNLVTIYGQPYTHQPESLGVPVVLKTDPEGKPARNTVKEVYTQIVQDLLDAEKNIDPAYVRKEITDTKAVTSLTAIRALLSRVYLYMGDWQKSADYATLVIGNTTLSVWTATEYTQVWGKAKADAGGEVIFQVFGTKTNSYYGSWNDISYMTNPNGYADCALSSDATSLFEEEDVRAKLFRTDKDKKSGMQWSSKYIGKGEGTPDANNVIVLRLSEMYLNRAEAIINGAAVSGVTALSDINKIRENRGVAKLTSVGREDIRLERRKELLYEGHHLFDLARWGVSVQRTDYTEQVNQNIDFPSDKWALPISKRELDANENLKQNPGY